MFSLTRFHCTHASFQAPRTDLDATGIGIDVLAQTPNGRQVCYELFKQHTRNCHEKDLEKKRTQFFSLAWLYIPLPIAVVSRPCLLSSAAPVDAAAFSF